MLHYCVTHNHRYTIDTFRSAARGRLDEVLQVRTYGNIDMSPAVGEKGPPIYIFTDIDRLHFPSNLVIRWNEFREQNPDAICLNYPTRTLIRFELLKTLHQAGINSFNVYSVLELDAPMRFPVFVRNRNSHQGPLTELLPDKDALLTAVERLRDFYSPQEMMVVEHLDVSDAGGVFRKYGAFLVGDELIPHHIQFSKNWLIKQSMLDHEAFLREELAYVTTPEPNEKALRKAFALAGIEYGRADFSVDATGIQVWEINTNPMIVGMETPNGIRLEVRNRIVECVLASLTRLAGGPAR
jgi:hypothetical protein